MSTRVEELVHRLEVDPATAQHLPEVRAPEVFDAWIRRCLELTSANPREGLPHVGTALVISRTSCQTAQCLGVTAAARRNLGELDRAMWLLEDAFEVSMGCAACEADLLRRRALTFASTDNESKALSDADASIDAYRLLEGPDHDLFGHGLGDAYLARGNVRQYFGLPGNEDLIRGTLDDFTQVLILADPEAHQTLYGLGLLNIGAVLRVVGGLENLKTANRHIRTARQYFKRKKHRANREQAHLDWQTAMIRFELRRHPEGREIVSEHPVDLRKMMRRALVDFIEVRMPAESSAVAADLALLAFPSRDAVRELIEETLERTKAKWKSFWPEVREAYEPIGLAMLDVRAATYREVRSTAAAGAGTAHEVKEGLRQAIKNLRQTCEDVAGEMLPCLLTWPA